MRLSPVFLVALVTASPLLLAKPISAEALTQQHKSAQAVPDSSATPPSTPSNNGVPSSTETTPVQPSSGETTTPAQPSGETQPTQTPTESAPTAPAASSEETQVLVGEVLVTTPTGAALPPDVEKQVYDVISTKPGRPTTRTKLQADINAVFATGYFSNVQATPEDTEIGVRVTFLVSPNPILKSVSTEGATVIEDGVVDRIFADQINKVTNLGQVQKGVKELETYYKDKGYVLAQVVDVKSQPDGTLILVVAEGVVEDIKVGFLNEEGKTTDKDEAPNKGYTRDFIITRELSLKPGDVFNKNAVQADLQKVFGLGIFDDVNLALNPGTDPKKVVVTVNVKERNTGSIAAGAGISSATGLFGTVSFQQQNFGGNNQKLGLDIQVGEREVLFDISFTDPWIGGDPLRTSYTINLFNRRLFSYVFDSFGDKPVGVGSSNVTARENRLGGGISFSRPLSKNATASLGFRYERVTITDDGSTIQPFDNAGNQTTIDPSGKDDLFLFQIAAAQDLRNDPLKPTSGSVIRVANEVALPFGNGSIFFNRIRASYSTYIPVKFTNFAEGAQALAFNIQAGTILGTVPPYEAFRIGGSNSVRGWDEGRIGSGRSFAIVSAEYRFPVFSILSGVLFAEYGTDLGSGSSVSGNPAGTRGKPGSGGGYGVGVRVQSPLGSIRIDYGIATDGSGTQFSFGLGEKF